MNRKRIICGAVLAGMSALWAARGGEESAVGNTVITSRTLEFDYRRHIAVFEGDVVVVDPQLTLHSDHLTVLFTPENEVKSVTAWGNVRLKQDDKTGLCERAIYLAKTGEVIMTGNARLFRGKDSVRGRKITFFVDEDRMTCEPGYLIIHPRDSGEGPSGFDGLVPSRTRDARPAGGGRSGDGAVQSGEYGP